MKVLILFALFAASQAAVLLHAPAVIGTGGSTQYRSQDNYGNYNFGYDEGHLTGGTFRKESGDAHGNVAGSYGLRDADGRIRIVNYVADAAGFRADIKTNEPGVEPKDPAHASINKAGVVVAPAASAVAYAPALPAAVPAPVAYAAPAPVAYAGHHYAGHHYAAPHYAGHHYAAPHYGFAYHY
ncbi:cuticle protein 14-like [Argiope bruennichi]|uniref:Cuticle protein 14 isoform b like protein n=1 Tax=Argiope bruennichi TaxID=94029 RepID=A0A8T0EX90_ARGBR|nr:cuticle protein 14-like [Argiope bruennichi]KAF8782304.1 Cuticle protein 14 isoform b like protein [Argiope bruennichi]